MQKIKRLRDEKHRRWIATLPCCVSGISGKTQAAHVRLGTTGGMGIKPDDFYCIPLSVEQHTRQHQIGERAYWGNHVERVHELANALYLISGDTDRAMEHIVRFVRAIRH